MKKHKKLAGWIWLFINLAVLSGGCGSTGRGKESERMEDLYRAGLGDYLKQELYLEEYDRQISDSEMNFIPNEDQEKSQAQKKDRMGLCYLYLRNELHLERLSDTQRKCLKGAAESFHKTNEVSEEAMKIIEDTFADVITPEKIETEEDKKVKTSYESKLIPDFVTMDALVLMIGTAEEFDSDGNYVNAAHEREKREALLRIAVRMEEELDGSLGDVPVRVLIER